MTFLPCKTSQKWLSILETYNLNQIVPTYYSDKRIKNINRSYLYHQFRKLQESHVVQYTVTVSDH